MRRELTLRRGRQGRMRNAGYGSLCTASRGPNARNSTRDTHRIRREATTDKIETPSSGSLPTSFHPRTNIVSQKTSRGKSKFLGLSDPPPKSSTATETTPPRTRKTSH